MSTPGSENTPLEAPELLLLSLGEWNPRIGMVPVSEAAPRWCQDALYADIAESAAAASKWAWALAHLLRGVVIFRIWL